jgi:hypothetical protein
MESYQGNYLTDKSALTVYHSGAATTATLSLVTNTLTLTVDGSPTVIDLIQPANDTLQELVNVINGESGWTAVLTGNPSTASASNMADQVSINVLGEANTVTLKTLFDDVTNWPATYTTIDKRNKVNQIEERIERITKDFFYSKTFDIKTDGNGQNRLYIPFKPNILTVTTIEVYGVDLDSDLWTYEARAVYLDLETATGSNPDFNNLLANLDSSVIFPAGLKNIRIVGTYGWNTVPSDIRISAQMMIMDEFDETLYDHWRDGSFSITGDSSYDNKARIYTGIMKVDRMLARYIKRRVFFAASKTRR